MFSCFHYRSCYNTNTLIMKEVTNMKSYFKVSLACYSLILLLGCSKQRSTYQQQLKKTQQLSPVRANRSTEQSSEKKETTKNTYLCNKNNSESTSTLVYTVEGTMLSTNRSKMLQIPEILNATQKMSRVCEEKYKVIMDSKIVK